MKLNNNIVKVNLFSIFLAVVLAVLYLWIQKGIIPLNYFEVAKVISLSVFLLVIPDLVKIVFFSKRNTFLSTSFITIGFIILISILGAVCKSTGISYPFVFIIFTLIGLILYIFKVRSFLNGALVPAIWGIGFGIFLGFLIWGIDFLSPIFFEKFQYLGRLSWDTIFHNTVANIFNTYNVPSTALDGTPYLGYHWGSHALIALYSNIIQINLYTFYNLAYPVVFIPLFFKSILVLILNVSEWRKFNLNINFFFFLVFLVFFLRLFSLQDTGIVSAMPFNSESYTLGLIFSFLFIDILINDLIRNNKIGILSLFILILSIILLSIVKISLGFLFMAVISYFFIRLRLYKNWKFIFYYIFLSIIFVICYKLFSSPSANKFTIFNSLGRVKWFAIYYFSYYIFLIFFLFLIFFFDQKENLFKKFKNRTYLDVEALIFIALVGILPGMIIQVDGNQHYFTDFQYWLSLILLLAYLPYFRDKTVTMVQTLKSYKILKFMIILLCINVGIRILNATGINLLAITKDKREIILNRQKNENNNVVQYFNLLKKLADLPISEKKQSCIYTDNFGKYLCNRFGYPAVFLSPSITGICSIEGIIDRSQIYFGFPLYTYKESENINQIAERVKSMGFTKMFVIKNDSLLNIITLKTVIIQ